MQSSRWHLHEKRVFLFGVDERGPEILRKEASES